MDKEKRAVYKREFNKERYKRIVLYAKPDELERWENEARNYGMSLNKFIRHCIEIKIQK